MGSFFIVRKKILKFFILNYNNYICTIVSNKLNKCIFYGKNNNQQIYPWYYRGGDLSSCELKPPFVALQPEGQPSLLNYQIPQESVYNATSYIGLGLPKEKFKQDQQSQTTSPIWNSIKEVSQLDTQGIQQALLSNNNLIVGYPVIEKKMKQEAVRITELSHNTFLDQVKTQTLFKKAAEQKALGISPDLMKNSPQISDLGSPNPNIYRNLYNTNAPEKDLLIGVKENKLNENLIAQQISKGKLPVARIRLSGEPEVNFIQKPDIAQPEITLVLHYKLASFLGDYGAGKVLKTVNLLPGERVSATVRSFKHNESVQLQSRNVLDSFSTYSADELQNAVENMSSFSSGHSEGGHETYGRDWNQGGEFGITISFLNLGLGAGSSGSETRSPSFNTANQQQINQLTSAVNSHIAGSNAEREININTETVSTSISETEESITRTYENINQSRTLNIVFRQMLQEYISITYLDQVSVQYYNGFPESRRLVKLTDLDQLLEDVLDPAAVEGVKNQIYRYLCNIFDYEQVSKGFIEKVDEELVNCINPQDQVEKISYIRKKKGLSQTAEGYTVPGIIMNVSKYTLRTDSAVADAVLGQGEALDCYNQHLQNAGVQAAELANQAQELANLQAEQYTTQNAEMWSTEKDKIEQAMEILNGITDPIEKAKLYKKVFTDCCDVPQSGGCGCQDTSSENA